MKKENRAATAFLLIGLAAAGRAFLAVPETAGMAEFSLSMLAVVGYLLLAPAGWRALACGVGQLVLELVLLGSQAAGGGAWLWLAPLLRLADLWLLAGTACLTWRAAQALAPAGTYGPRNARMPATLLALLAGQTVLLPLHTALPQAQVLAVLNAACFVAFSVVLLWYTVLLLRAYTALKQGKR